ncbi:alpha-1,3-mannosyl-glycoprotein 2-beta-N-acetylglucosaminyltransferase isoform X1 [Hydra vulgaris]|uniref:alpha-1,3-mannosyl-glycoprotein 2-beta-N-acetylglucosaminyltransferase isoform X1 n=2 Tax=Hydra vulgaris TaxID=6087 RepID=UPI0032EA8CD6
MSAPLNSMRIMKKLVTNAVSCRCKKSTKFIIIFIGGFFLIANFISIKYLIRYDLKNYARVKSNQMTLNENKMTNEYILENEKEIMTKESLLENGKEIITKESFLENENNKMEDFHEVIITRPIEIESKMSGDKNFNNESFISDNSKTAPPLNNSMVLLVIACNRPSVRRCLDNIFKYKPLSVNIPVIVSQDCGDEPTSKVISSYGNKLIHIKQPDLGEIHNIPSNMKMYKGYYKISRHYKWALNQVFEHHGADSAIIVEDDIDIAPDFFEYFLATRPLMELDQSIYCISAWNDNGKVDSVDPLAIDLLYRTDFFPGLGWLITKKIWQEMKPKWPLGFWDDWLRAPSQRKDRVCIRPEISRTKTFGRIGVSQGQFFDQYLQYIKLNENPFPFRDYDLSYLLKENYDNEFLRKVQNSPQKSIHEILSIIDRQEYARVSYNSNDEFIFIAKQLGIMSDLKAGVPRMAYKGIVSVFKNNKRIFVSPSLDWKGYKEE